MEKKKYIRKKEEHLSIEYNRYEQAEISRIIQCFADLYNFKVTNVFAVNSAISQYTKKLKALTEKCKIDTSLLDQTTANPLIPIKPNIPREEVVKFVVRANSLIVENLDVAIEEFEAVSGKRFSKSAAVRTAIGIYTEKLVYFSRQYKKDKLYDEAKILKAIMP
jgi:hypothetical protein